MVARQLRPLAVLAVLWLAGPAPAGAQTEDIPLPEIAGAAEGGGNQRVAAAPSGAGFQWRAAVTQTFFFTSIQTLGRLSNQSTRVNLGGPFVNDWMKSAAGLFDANWNDGNKIATNYIAHPAGGAVYANIARQNSKYRALLPGDEGCARGVMMAMAFAAVASLNHEIGPISEASVGNIGMRNPDQQGWIEPVITPTLGAAWMVMEDVVYKHVLSKIDGRKSRVFWAVVLNPSRSAAGVMAGRMPGRR